AGRGPPVWRRRAPARRRLGRGAARLIFDPILRRWIDPPLDRAAQWCAQRGARANTVTLLGLAIGLCAVPLLAFDQYGWALIVILLNRLIDGLDGAPSRRNGLNPFGGYLEIGCVLAFY